jgi:myosin heavy subunit
MASCVTIQAWWRMIRIRGLHRRAIAGVVRLQALARTFLLQKAFHGHEAMAINIQGAWRMYRARRDYLHVKCSVIVIQSLARRFVCRRAFRSRLWAIRIIQRWMFLLCQHATRHLRRSMDAVQFVHASRNGQHVSSSSLPFFRRRFLHHRNKVITIQKWWRAVLRKLKSLRALTVTASNTAPVPLNIEDVIRPRHRSPHSKFSGVSSRSTIEDSKFSSRRQSYFAGVFGKMKG